MWIKFSFVNKWLIDRGDQLYVITDESDDFDEFRMDVQQVKMKIVSLNDDVDDFYFTDTEMDGNVNRNVPKRFSSLRSGSYLIQKWSERSAQSW